MIVRKPVRWFAVVGLALMLLLTAWRGGARGESTLAASPQAATSCIEASAAGTPAAVHDTDAPEGHGEHQQGDQGAAGQSPYAEGYDRAAPIRALTPDEVAQIERGEGAGFALPAELNGVPGPRHVLDLAADLGLSVDQRARVQAIFDEMRAAVIPAGERYLAAELTLEEGFRCGTLTEETLPEMVGEVNRLRGELQATHLGAHLKTAAVLTAAQIETYQRIRGYR